jgi:hypothetical protein
MSFRQGKQERFVSEEQHPVSIKLQNELFPFIFMIREQNSSVTMRIYWFYSLISDLLVALAGIGSAQSILSLRNTNTAAQPANISVTVFLEKRSLRNQSMSDCLSLGGDSMILFRCGHFRNIGREILPPTQEFLTAQSFFPVCILIIEEEDSVSVALLNERHCPQAPQNKPASRHKNEKKIERETKASVLDCTGSSFENAMNHLYHKSINHLF